MSEMDNVKVKITTFRKDGKNASFYDTPFVTDLSEFLTDVGWTGGPAVYQFEFVLARHTPGRIPDFDDCFDLNGVQHSLAGIGTVLKQIYDETTGLLIDNYLANDGDMFQVAINIDEVNVTDPTRWAPYMYDAIAGGRTLKGVPGRMVFVSEESELNRFTDVWPGCLAATYGFGQMWQLDGSGEWIKIGTEEDNS